MLDEIVPFVVSCPPDTLPLPREPLPPFTITPPTPRPGDTIKVSFQKGSNATHDGNLFMAFSSGRDIEFVDIADDDTVSVPENLQGTVYAVICFGDILTEGNSVSAPIVMEFGVTPSQP